MAYRLRSAFCGAIHHVFNRGNYRRDLFSQQGTIESFRACFFEAAVRFQWRVHTFALMRNHYHFGLETPEPNLSIGMQWLQSTFAVRFNRFRRERGHLFQGRYHSLLVEPGEALVRVVDYIHLNPVAVKATTVAQLPRILTISLSYFMDPIGRTFCRANLGSEH